MLILITGPYRSGTDGDPRAMAANLARLEAAAWPTECPRSTPQETA
jgi:hypothetical protein